MENNYEFDVTFTCKHDNCNDGFKEYAIGHVMNLSRFHKHIISGDIKVDRQSSIVKVEILVHVPGHHFLAAHEEHTHDKAFDPAIEKIKIQLKKHQDKLNEHRPLPVKEPVEVIDEEIDTDEYSDEFVE